MAVIAMGPPCVRGRWRDAAGAVAGPVRSGGAGCLDFT